MLVVVASILCQIFGKEVNVDISWIIVMAERVIAGDRLYVDIIEANPPMTLWLYLPGVMFAHAAGISAEAGVYVYTYLLCLLGFGFASYLVYNARLPESRTLWLLSPALLALLLLLPQYDFTEREQIGVALLAPLLVVMAWRVSGGSGNSPPVFLAIVAGFCGSVIILVKPYYALVVLAPSLYVCWRQRTLRALFYPENFAIAASCALYLAAVMKLYPEFLQTIFPLLADTYMRESSPWVIAQQFAPPFAALVACYFMVRRRSPTTFGDILIFAGIAAFVPLVYQGKGWAYHAYPAFTLALAALMIAVANAASQSAGASNARTSTYIAAGALAVSALLGAQYFLQTPAEDQATIAKVRERYSAPSVSLIGPGIQGGQPLTRSVNGKWLDQFCSDWALYFAINYGAVERKTGSADRAEHYARLIDDLAARKIAGLKANPPDILLVESKYESLVQRVLGDPAMAGYMNMYRKLAEDPKRVVYERIGS